MYEPESDIRQHGIIAICRGIYKDDLSFLAQALYDGGIRYIEVTFDRKDPDNVIKTPQAIRELHAAFPQMHVGAGTVTSIDQLNAADAGNAEFIISPNTNVELIRRTRELGLISIPGAMTPTEILTAYDAGANFVKLFPAADLGAAYVKAVRSPINDIPLLATGGIGTNNFADFLKVGCVGAGIGGSLCSKKAIAERDHDALTAYAAELVEIFKKEAVK